MTPTRWLATPRGRGLALAAAMILLAALGLHRSLWTPDEPREAEISREMYVAPTVVPTLDGQPFYEKPPLYYALVAALFAVTGGPSILAARAVSALAGLATLAVLWAWARRAAGPRVAALAVLLLGTAGQFVLSTHWVLLDPLLMLFSTLAFWAGWEVARGEGPRRGFLLLFYAALALALWTKGLVGPALVLVGLGAWALLERRQRPWRRFHPLLGALFLAAAVLSVAGAIYLAGGREALWQWGWVNHVDRFLHPEGTGHAKPITYYLGRVPLVVLPWLVPLADLFVRRFWKPGATLPLRRYCGAAVLAGVVLLSLSSTKRETYLLPLFAPLFLLLALAVEDRLTAASPATGWRRAGEWVQAGLLALLAIVPGAAVLGYTRRPEVAAIVLLVAGIALAAGLLTATARHRRARAALLAAGAAVLFAGGALAVALPALEPQKDFTPMVEAVDRALPPGAPVPALGSDESLLGVVPFLTGRRVEAVTPADLESAARAETLPAFVLVQEKRGVAHRPPVLESRYAIVRSRRLGRGRTLSLWQRTPTDRPDVSSGPNPS